MYMCLVCNCMAVNMYIHLFHVTLEIWDENIPRYTVHVVGSVHMYR